MVYIIGDLTGENCPEPTVCGIVLCGGHLKFSPVEVTVSITMSYHLAKYKTNWTIVNLLLFQWSYEYK